jgi:glucosamine kinase
MLLIADSGSSKTTWSLVNPLNGISETCKTAGINPMYQDEETIYKLLHEEFTLQVPENVSVYFYGAGCFSNSVNQIVEQALHRFFGSKPEFTGTDLMAAARSLCGNHEGIACILGTGSNSCYYNGHEIASQVSPLGFMLGDEGSGAVIGKKLVADVLKNQVPASVREKFFDTYKLTQARIIEQVYKKPMPNRFLAQFTRFISDHPEESVLRDLVLTSFHEFFNRNIRQYPEAKRLPVHFTGSIAFVFQGLLQESAHACGFETGRITPSPMEGLIQYHLKA